MPRYTLPPGNPNQKAFRIFAYGSIGTMLTLLLISESGWVDSDATIHAMGWAEVGLLIMFMGGVFVLIARNSVWQFWQKVAFDLADDKIIRAKENSPLIEIPLKQINFHGESRNGLLVRGGEPTKTFLISKSINNFEELKRQLNGYCEVIAVDTKISYRPALPFVLAVVAYAVLFLSKAGAVVMVAGVLALLIQGWAIFSMRKVLAKTRSPKLLMFAFLFSWVMLAWLVYQRVSSAV